jgi:hypothetical protein
MADSDQETGNFLQRLVEELIEQLDWVRKILSDKAARTAIETELGIGAGRCPSGVPESASITAYREAATRGDKIDKQVALDVLAEIFDVYDSIVELGEAASDGGGKEAARELAHSLLHLLLLGYVRLRYPRLHKLGQLLGFVEEISSTNLSEKVYFDRVPELLEDVGGYFEKRFGRLSTEQDAKVWSDSLFPVIAAILAQQGYREADGKHTLLPSLIATKNVIYGWDAAPGSRSQVADAISARALSIGFDYRKPDVAEGGEVSGQINLTLLFVPRSDGGPGVFLSFGRTGEIDGKINDEWRLKLESRSAGAIDFLIGKNMAVGGSSDNTGMSITVGPEVSAPGRKYVIPDSRGMRLEFGRLSFKGDISKDGAGFEITAEDGAFVISSDECDGFVAEVLPGQKTSPAEANHPPAKETRIGLNLGLGISSERGFYITGGTGLQAVIPVGKTVGPATIQQLLLKLAPATDPKPARLTAEASAAISAKLGPVTATVDQIGLRALVPFAKNDNGKWDFSVGFKPPTGVGLKIDSPSVTGGGFLFYDTERAQYGGVVELEFTKSHLALKAIGLISTRLPGGAKGFSMVIIITAEGFKPIPLGLGFSLTGIGGLVAINRTFNEDAVRGGIKSHALERVLFPQDPIRHAPQIISSLDTFFPAKKGSYLFGLLAQISWGLSSPLKMELALILEAGQRFRLIVLGHLSLTLPREDQDLVRLNMDAVGVIDFDQGTASLDAALYDSRLLKKFVLTGQMAMRLRWGSSPLFALSVGGFHPAFKPPSDFPALERISISLSESEDFRLRCEGYFALTSNTLQFGSRAELLAKGGGFSIHGEIGYDVLIQFDPFMFVAGFHASVQLKHGSTNLFKVSVAGELSGPRPLHVKGKATFEIFWCDFSVGFNKTLVSGEPPPRPEPLKVMDRLKPALADARNWGGQLPDGERRLVSLRERQVPGEIALHPLGKLSVKQSVVPLDLEIAKFGPTTPADARLFKLNSVSVSGKSVAFERERDFFAPAEFLQMTDDEKLTAPSFEPLTAGFSLNSDGFILPTGDLDLIEEPAIRYETLIIDNKDKPARKPATPTPLNATYLAKQISFGAAARSDVRRSVAAKYSPAISKKALLKTGWVLVSSTDQSRQPAPGVEAGKLVAYAEAFQALQQLKRENPARAKGLMIIRASEPVS